MAQILKLYLCFLLLLISTLVQAEHPVVHRRSRARTFIEAQCQHTLHSDLCIRSLSYYIKDLATNPTHHQLAQIALKVSLVKAESTRAYVTEVAKELKQTNAKANTAIEECLDQINDGVTQLTNCIKEAGKIREDGETVNFPWHASNVETWMSTALTDTAMCIDGFSGRAIGGKTKAMIKAKVVNLQEATSNALALFNRFAARYRSAHVKRP